MSTTVDGEEQEVVGHDSESMDGFDAKFATGKLQMHPTRAASSAASSTSTAGEYPPPNGAQPKPEEIRDREIAGHIRKAHNAWDRVRRELDATIAVSAVNVNTKGCKFERDLLTVVETGKDLDAQIVALEQKFMCDTRYSPEEIELAAECGRQLKTTMRTGSKLASAMKQWFRL